MERNTTLCSNFSLLKTCKTVSFGWDPEQYNLVLLMNIDAKSYAKQYQIKFVSILESNTSRANRVYPGKAPMDQLQSRKQVCLVLIYIPGIYHSSWDIIGAQ